MVENGYNNIFESQKANILQHTNPENNNIPVTEETLENINTNITKDAVSSNELSSVEDSNDVYNKVYDSYIKQGNGKAIATEYGLIALAQLYAKNNGKTNEEIKDDVQKYVMANNLNDSEFEQAFKTFVEEGTVTHLVQVAQKTLFKKILIFPLFYLLLRLPLLNPQLQLKLIIMNQQLHLKLIITNQQLQLNLIIMNLQLQYLK